jgi:hypothetical protein
MADYWMASMHRKSTLSHQYIPRNMDKNEKDVSPDEITE